MMNNSWSMRMLLLAQVLVMQAVAVPATTPLVKRGLDSQLICINNKEPAFKNSWLTAARCKTRTTYEVGCAIKESNADKYFPAACPHNEICINVDRPGGGYIINVPQSLQPKVGYKTLVEAAPDVICKSSTQLKGQTVKAAGVPSAELDFAVTPKPGDEAYLWQVVCAKTTLAGALHTTNDLQLDLFINGVLQASTKPGQWYVTKDITPGMPRVAAQCKLHGSGSAAFYADTNIRDPSPSGI